ncbi:sulfate adenylyltransferase subunit 1 [Fimbriimonas ginsengisoli]|uniref:sulfate adenylyltransferase n=1 Tax=Fimbriimonas ginsengisoli Gsoil 348 TaxID=661478 RepID=A0A068NL89_FIMGI|nr:GTP-binding protein [Fimbriimonas ginsengisoli]AIE84343.1 sulfate adenylyltransferase, large subunit subfamily [Fimbriimonas ginsengisoli Gsoil 348]
MDTLRFATAGSVDDGKSSLIGRLLYDSKSILEDQMLAIERASRNRGADQVELALLTDGLRAEREQNITIDVAYRYFSTARRKFIIADTPGHLQYTRNMVTGTSTADLSVILIDARKGVLSQSKRHAAISSLLGLRTLVVAVNKMDLVEFSEAVFRRIEAEFRAFTNRLGIADVTFIPISALNGDNVVDPSEQTPWYSGPTLLQFLEEVEVARQPRTGFRLPVQYVVRPHQDFRGFAGQVESGSVRVGDLVGVASSGIRSAVRSLHVAGEPADEARAGQPAVVEIDRDVDISRGDLLFDPSSAPERADRVEAVVCWLADTPLALGKRYLVLHATRRISGVIESVTSRIDVDTLDPVAATHLGLNELGRIRLRTAGPLYFDPYERNSATGSFVLVDPETNGTVAAGMIQTSYLDEEPAPDSGRVVWINGNGGRAPRLVAELQALGRRVVLLSADTFGAGASEPLARLARSAASQGFDVLVAAPAIATGSREWPTYPDEGQPFDLLLESVLPHFDRITQPASATEFSI